MTSDKEPTRARNRSELMQVTASLPRRSDAHRNRERILDSAAATLSTNHEASFEQIVADSGLARSTVYRHFPSRSALIDALIDRQLNAARALLDRARPSEPPFEDALERMTDAALRAGAESWNLLTLAGDGSIASSPPVTDIESAVHDLMQLGVDEGVLRDDIPIDWHIDAYFALTACAVRDANDSRSFEAHVVDDLFLSGFGSREVHLR